MKLSQKPRIQRSGDPTTAASALFPACVAVSLIFVVFWVFLPCLDYEFVCFDDDLNIYFNIHLLQLGPEMVGWAFGDMLYTRRAMPLGWLTISAIYSSAGLKPHLFHLANLLLHIINTLLLWRLVGRWVARDFPATDAAFRWVAAGLAVAWWAINPMRAETVGWSSGILYTAALTWFLMSWCVLDQSASSKDHRVRNRLALASLLYIASLLTYPIAMGGGALMLLRNWRRSDGTRLYSIRALSMWFLVPGVVVCLLNLAAAYFARFSSIAWTAPPTLNHFGVLERVLQASYSGVYYLWKPWVPLDLSPVYDHLLDFGTHSPSGWLSLSFIVMASALAFLLRQQQRAVVFFWTIAYLILVVPFLGLATRPHFTNDRYGYIVTLPMVVLLAIGLLSIKSAPRRFATLACMAVLLLANSFSARAQLGIWRNTESLLTHVLGNVSDPEQRTLNVWQLARSYGIEGRFAEALQTLHAPDARIPSKRLQAHVVELEKMQARAAADGIAPKAQMHHGHAIVHWQNGRLVEARNHAREALLISPKFARARGSMALLYLSGGDPWRALANWRIAGELGWRPPVEISRSFWRNFEEVTGHSWGGQREL